MLSSLKFPVKPVKLNLTKIYMFSASIKKTFYSFVNAVSRKSKMSYSAFPLLFYKIVNNFVFFAEESINVFFTNVMKKIKIKIVNPCFFKLTLKNLLCLVHIGKIISGKFCCKIIAVARIF